MYSAFCISLTVSTCLQSYLTKYLFVPLTAFSNTHNVLICSITTYSDIWDWDRKQIQVRDTPLYSGSLMAKLFYSSHSTH